MTRAFLLGVAVCAACGATPSRPSPPSAATSAPSAAPDPCAGRDGLVLETPDAVPSRWDGRSSVVGGEAALVVRWCGLGIATVERVEVFDASGAATVHELDTTRSRLAHGETLTRVITGRAEPSSLGILVTGSADARPVEARGELASVDDPALLAARDACTAQHGTFGAAGMAQTLLCTRPTRDAGQRCLSSAECEGLCLADHEETVSTSPDGRDCPEGTTLRLHVGRCDSQVPHFGCSSVLDALRSECVGPGALRGRSTTCVD